MLSRLCVRRNVSGLPGNLSPKALLEAAKSRRQMKPNLHLGLS